MEKIFVRTKNGNSYCDTEQGVIIGSGEWQEVQETDNISRKIADGALFKQTKEEAAEFEAKAVANASAKKGDKK